MDVRIGDEVRWKWGYGWATGIVLDVIPRKTSIVSRGKYITRNGTDTNPAVIIQHANGNEVIKLLHELVLDEPH